MIKKITAVLALTSLVSGCEMLMGQTPEYTESDLVAYKQKLFTGCMTQGLKNGSAEESVKAACTCSVKHYESKLTWGQWGELIAAGKQRNVQGEIFLLRRYGSDLSAECNPLGEKI